MIEFDADVAKMLDRAYAGRDFLHRRHANIAALAPSPGAHVLDIGCGTGLMLKELAGAVGPEGRVTGLDASKEMLARAKTLCESEPIIDLVEGTASTLPFDDAAFDGVISVQVFEYIDDVALTLEECRRVLKPGGTLVIGDMHFGTLVWHSDDPERMDRMIKAWDPHFRHRDLPAWLPGLLRAAGFRNVRSTPVTFMDAERRSDGVAGMMQHLMAGFAVRTEQVAEEDARAWSDEQNQLAREGRFFFSITHVVTAAEAA